MQILLENRKKIVKKLGEKPLEISLSEKGVLVTSDSSYLIYNESLDYKIISIEGIKTILEAGQLVGLSNDVVFFDFDEDLPCSLKQKKIFSISGQLHRFCITPDEKIWYTAKYEEGNELGVVNLSNTSEKIIIDSDSIEVLKYWAEFNCIIAAGKWNNLGFLDFYDLNLQKIVRHEFSYSVTAVCIDNNHLIIAATFSIFYFCVSDLFFPEKIASYSYTNRINDIAKSSLYYLAATEGQGIKAFMTENSEIKFYLWSKNHKNVKSVICIGQYAVGIDIEGNLIVFDLETHVVNTINLENGGRCLLPGLLQKNNMQDSSKLGFLVLCLNGEIVEVRFENTENKKNLIKSIIEKCEQESIIESENEFLANQFLKSSQTLNLNLIGYYDKLSNSSKTELKSQYPTIEKEIKLLR